MANLLSKLDRQVLLFLLHPWAEQRQSIFSIERELANGLLPGTAQGNVHAPVLCQGNNPQVAQNFVLLFLAQVGMLLDELFYLFLGHVLFYPIRFRLKVGCRNAKPYQKPPCDFHAPLGKRFVELRLAAVICMAFEHEVSIRPVGEVLLKGTRQRKEGFLLTLH